MGDSYPGGQGVLSFQQIEQLWVNNGGDPRWAPLMAAIAEAESSGHTGVLNDTPATGDYSVGLWQINYYQSLMLPRTQSYGSPQQLLADPNRQAKAAIALFANGSGAGNWKGDAAWRAWQSQGAPLYPTQAELASWGASTSSAAGTAASLGPSTSPAAGSGSLASQYSGISVPLLGQIVSPQQEVTIKGWFLMIAGAFVGTVGLAVVLGSLGLESKISRAIPGPVGFAAVEVQARTSKARGTSSSAPPPPAPAAAYRAGYDMGGRDENARREGQAQNARNRRQSGPSAPGARRTASETRQGSRARLERSRAGLSAEQRRQVETF